MAKKKRYDIRAIFDEIKGDMFSSMLRTLSHHERDEEKEGFRWEQWQSAKLRALNAYAIENDRLIKRRQEEISRLAREEIQKAFESGYNIQMPQDFTPRAAQGEPLPKAPPEKDFFGVNQKKINALIKSVDKDLAKAEYATLRKADDIYRQTVFKTEMHMATGAKTLNQAIDKAVKDFLAQGIRSVRYKDGRSVDVATYAEMALRTANQRAKLTGEGTKRDEWGIHTVFVSAHAGTCELCRPWQGKVLIDDVFASGTLEEAKAAGHQLLSEAITAGLLHPNCRHNIATYFPGVTKLPEVPEDDVVEKNYTAEQRQREIERQIRKWKQLSSYALDPESEVEYERNLKAAQARMRDHLKKNPQLRRQPRREKAYPETEAKQAGYQAKALKDKAKHDKIKDIRDYIKSDAQTKHVHEGRQGKHILGHNNYTPGKSYLTVSMDEIQKLVNQYAGTGRINFYKSGGWDSKEVIFAKKTIGKVVDVATGQTKETTAFKIHYSKKGVHVVPFKGKQK